MAFFDMSATILKSLFTKPSTRRYPYVKRPFFQKTRGSIRIEIDKCIFCSLCAKKCPTYALKVNKEEKSWTINRLKCCMCTYCVDVCPKKCLHNENQYSGAVTDHSEEVFKNA
jgi:ech hydrogenase subunit F